MSTDMQSVRTTITSMSVQISVLTERLQKKEEDIEEMNSRTKGLDGRLKKIEEEVEQQQITNRQDNIVFFGVPEKEGRESSDDCASTMVTLLKAGLYKLGSRGGSLKKKNLPGQVGAPLEHTAHHQNLTNWPSNFQSAAFT